MLASPQDTASVDSTGTCNLNLPNSSVYARFLYLIRYLTRNGFYVIVDNHLNVDALAQDDPSEGALSNPPSTLHALHAEHLRRSGTCCKMHMLQAGHVLGGSRLWNTYDWSL